MGHEVLLTQCVSNLLSNAVKFVEPGVTPRIRIWAEVGFFDAGSAPSPGGSRNTTPRSMVRVWIEDNGIGIAPKDRDRAFRMFERLNSNAVYQGTGIGLTVVRRAVERMGGAIDFESTPGQGSRFRIALLEARTP
jgi:signal transduction histidine kinase